MSVLHLLLKLEKKGIKIQLVNSQLKINAPKGKLTPGLLKELTGKKEEIIQFLQENVQLQVKHEPIRPSEKKEYYTMSSAQKRLYIVQELNKKSTNYNMSRIMSLEGPFDPSKMEKTFRQLMQRQESFRTSFVMMKEEFVQRIHEEVEFGYEYFNLSDPGAVQRNGEKKEKEIVKHFCKPFDLSGAPLLRVGLIKLAGEKYILMVDIHHIICDGISLDIVMREFIFLYSQQKPPELKLQYRDFSQWQNQLARSGKIEKQEQYWLNRFKDKIPVIDLPLDYPRTSASLTKGSKYSFQIDSQLYAGLGQLVSETEATLFMVLLAVYTILLSKYSGQEDIVVESPTAGRMHTDLESLIGLFANLLAMRNQPRGEKSFREFLMNVKVNALNAYENQDYQFENLVWNLKIKMEAGKNPLIDTVFAMQNLGTKKIEVNNRETANKTRVSPYETDISRVSYELILTAIEGRGVISMLVEYSTELFKESTARRISKHYLEILKQILANKDINLKDIQITYDLLTADSNIIPDDQAGFIL